MNKLSRITRFATFGLAGVIAAGLTAAQAKDALRVSVVDADGAVQIDENGGFQTPSTYAVGTMKLWFQIAGDQFPADTPFKTVTLCLDIVGGKAKPATKYPATVFLEQVGTPEVELTATPDAPVFASAASEQCVDIDISVPGEIANDPAYQIPYTEIQGNLQISTPPKTYLDTVTTVQFRLTLVPDSGPCVKPLHTVANQALSASLVSSGIDLQVHTNNGLQGATQARHLVALVNTCDDDVTVDLKTAINENFKAQSASAVQTTTENQTPVDLTELLAFNYADNTWTNNGVSMCLKGVTVPANQTFVMYEHMSMKTVAEGVKWPGAYGNIANTYANWFYPGFAFEAHDYDLVANCATLPLSADVDPNTGSVSLPIKVIKYTGPGAPDDEFRPAP